VAYLVAALSVAAHIAVSALGTAPFGMVDLRVYVDSAAHLTDGTLYSYLSGPLDLPFTYPPFGALLFAVIAPIPWAVLRGLWQAASIAALGVMVHASLRLLGRAGRDRDRPLPDATTAVLLISAAALWLEPVRTTLNYGQVNLFIGAALLAGAASARDWAAGLSVGITAGVKLVPAITGLYYLLGRRWRAVAWSAALFAATVGLAAAFVPLQSWQYFSRLMFDASRTGPIGSAINQSWRGALLRIAGHDVPRWWVAVAVACVLVGLWAARRSLLAGDRLAGLVAIEMIGLLVSPISWSHHWVWVVPLLIWAALGPARGHLAVRAVAVAWLAVTASYLVSLLLLAEKAAGTVTGRPGWQAWLGAAYAVLGTVTLVVIGRAHRRTPHPHTEAVPARPAVNGDG
jgi:alpha-1,2-mannosyltransferase